MLYGVVWVPLGGDLQRLCPSWWVSDLRTYLELLASSTFLVAELKGLAHLARKLLLTLVSGPEKTHASMMKHVS